jgi:hypothetical protein
MTSDTLSETAKNEIYLKDFLEGSPITVAGDFLAETGFEGKSGHPVTRDWNPNRVSYVVVLSATTLEYVVKNIRVG